MTAGPAPHPAPGPPGGVLVAGVAVSFLGALMLATVVWLVLLLAAVDQACTDRGTDPAGAYAGPGVAGLSPRQTGRAAAVVGQGRRMGVPDAGIVVALAVVSRESAFRVLANDGQGGDLAADQQPIARSLALPHDGVGTDHGSLGLFQQQWPWWGSMAELMDPGASAAKFYTALRQVPNWQRLRLTVAAQRVQHSSYPDAYTGHRRLAERLLAELGGAGRLPGDNGALPAGGTAPAAGAGDRYRLGPVRPQLRDLVGLLAPRFGITTVGGYRAEARDPQGHPAGLAADFMVPLTPAGRRQGDQLAGYARAHAARLGIDYVIWRQRIWSLARRSEGWRALADRGGPTANHDDHVHINVRRTGAVTLRPAVTPAGAAGTAEDTVQGPGCTDAVPAGSAAGGAVAYPLPAGSGYRDLKNWGSGGSRWARGHTGTDLSVGCGTPVRAAHAGTVVIDTTQSWAGRWLVKVTTGPRSLTTWYAHLQAVTAGHGRQVRAGQQIGRVGALGNATGCHLHFEVHLRNGSIYQDNVNPTTWLARHVARPGVGVMVPAGTGSLPPSTGAAGAFNVLSFNVLGSSHTAGRGKKPSWASGPTRMRGAVGYLAAYRADLVGFQELQHDQQAAFRRLTGGAWAVWNHGRDTDNSIAWRKDKFRLVRATSIGVPYFTGPRRMPVLLLQAVGAGWQVWAVNVHNPADTRRWCCNAGKRARALAIERALVRRLAATGRPVVMTGDFNARRPVMCAITRGELMSAAGHGSGCPHSDRGLGIDWILGHGVQFSGFRADRSPQRRRVADHPVIAARATLR